MTSDSDELIIEGFSEKTAGCDLTDTMRITFDAMIRIRMKLAEFGIEIDVPKTISVSGKKYSIDVLKKDCKKPS